MHYYLHAGKVILPDDERTNVYLEVRDGQFGQLLTQRPEDGLIIDYSDAIIAPGLVDTHIHGYDGYDVMDNDPEGLQVIAEGLLECGVTHWLPTTLTASRKELDEVCRTIAETKPQVSGAKIEGIFLEGPFFTEKYKGAQNAHYMSDPSIEQLERWLQLSNGLVSKIAIAPEREGTQEFINYARSQGVTVALGHSDATYAQAQQAVAAGASIFVHTYNGMRPLHHREPGMVGAALTLPTTYAELICDGHHVHPAACELVFQSCGPQRTVLITDCMRAGGLADGPSRLGEFEVIVQDGAARLKDSGNLAGSILKLIEAVRHVVDWSDLTIAQALRMASQTPAESVGIDDRCGRIEAGRTADFIVLTPELDLLATYLEGEKRYTAD